VGERGGPCVVIGIGNTDRGDDAVGHAVARRLRGMLPPEVRILEHDGELSSLLAHLGEASTVFLIDAAAGISPGAVARFDVGAAPLPADLSSVSSHGTGLAVAIELARALDELPARCTVYAIGAWRFGLGASLSPAVFEAIRLVAERVTSEIASLVDGNRDA
jgi:hydrogenase maturation protease